MRCVVSFQTFIRENIIGDGLQKLRHAFKHSIRIDFVAFKKVAYGGFLQPNKYGPMLSIRLIIAFNR